MVTDSTRLTAPIVLCLLLLTAVGCGSAMTTLEGEKDYDYTQYIDHLLVVTQFPEDLQPIGRAVSKEIEATLKPHNRTVSNMVVSADDSLVVQRGQLQADILKQARSLESTQVLVITLPEPGAARSGSDVVTGMDGSGMPGAVVGGYLYDFKLYVYDVEMEHQVFKGHVDSATPARQSDETTGREIGEDLVEGLVEYSLLPPFVLDASAE